MISVSGSCFDRLFGWIGRVCSWKIALSSDAEESEIPEAKAGIVGFFGRIWTQNANFKHLAIHGKHAAKKGLEGQHKS